MTPVWLSLRLVIAIHHEQLAEHGGPAGVRDAGRVEAALERPKNLLAYGQPDIFDLAASYGFGICQAHGFVDGNKRTSLVATELFLELNGQRLGADDADVVRQWLSLAAGLVSEEELATWLRESCFASS
ncbi:MAG: type II toxin-antitoxin system death-on-curing family toxin [Flavobacteriaceae bacterium]